MRGLEDAVKLAVQAHSGQVDKQGQPYVLHPLRVMATFNDTHRAIVAVLHDVIEDTEIDEAQLRDLFGERVAADVQELTKREGETYIANYIVRIAGHASDEALDVKLADLADNLDISRGPIPISLYRRYREAQTILEEERIARTAKRNGG